MQPSLLPLLSLFGSCIAAAEPGVRYKLPVPAQDMWQARGLSSRQLLPNSSDTTSGSCCTMGETTVCCEAYVTCSFKDAKPFCEDQCIASVDNLCGDQNSCCSDPFQCPTDGSHVCVAPDGRTTTEDTPTTSVNGTVVGAATATANGNGTAGGSRNASVTAGKGKSSSGAAQPAVTAMGWGAAGLVGVVGVLAL